MNYYVSSGTLNHTHSLTGVASATSRGNRYHSFTTHWLKMNLRTSRLAHCFDNFILCSPRLMVIFTSWQVEELFSVNCLPSCH